MKYEIKTTTISKGEWKPEYPYLDEAKKILTNKQKLSCLKKFQNKNNTPNTNKKLNFMTNKILIQ